MRQRRGAEVEADEARLVLADGSEFLGHSIGYPSPVAGEVVFSTGMVGYPQAFTDPSYKGQILALTYPLIGNYGMPPFSSEDGLEEFYESDCAMVSGVLVADYSTNYSHWNSETSLSQWLYNNRVPGLSGIDTRALTRKLREEGSMLGKILFGSEEIQFMDPNRRNLVEQVSIREPVFHGSGERRVLLVDCGCKHSIIRNLTNRGFEVRRVPWDHPILEEDCHGVLLSSGPGDPKTCMKLAGDVKELIERNVPVFGICLGHQILSLAIGADTKKMRYGHRSQNQPVEDRTSGRCFVTTQNHGYVVETEDLPDGWSPLFVNLNDGTNEGIIHESGRFMGVQFHPEASPGPVDTGFLFDTFAETLR